MQKIKNISVIGSGNVATHLVKNLYKSGIVIDYIFSKNIENAKILSNEVNAIPIDKLKNIKCNSDFYLFAVSDSVIEHLAEELNIYCGSNLQVAHTSGMVASMIFEKYFDNFGVFYPLQTFTKERKINIEDVPFFITANNTTFEKNLIKTAKILSKKTNTISDNNRKVLHVAAVFANNFTNYLYGISKDILDKENLDFEILFPLIKETAGKILDSYDPVSIQTGPAIRHDSNTIKQHLKFLDKHPGYKDVYRFLTEKIIESIVK